MRLAVLFYFIVTNGIKVTQQCQTENGSRKGLVVALVLPNYKKKKIKAKKKKKKFSGKIIII
jgi:hypothetical protein